jgi:hypothetical protein
MIKKSKNNSKKKLKSIAAEQKYIRETYFNRYIRLRDAVNGYITCVTCGDVIHWKEANAGHFKHGLDFVEDNQHGQCVKCNLYNSGRLDRYAIYILDRYGRERVDELEFMSRNRPKYSRSELAEIKEKYKKKCKELEAL